MPLSRGYATGSDYYDLLDYPFARVPRNGWGVDTAELKRQWRRKQALVHPDRMINKSAEEQESAAAHSAQVNRAYETLAKPLSRAEYLVSRFGRETQEGEIQADPMLLMEVMELQEGVENASSHEEIDELDAQNSAHLSETLAALDEAFGADPPDLEAANKHIAELRYWTNIERAISDWRVAHA
ncbi:molecular chaperone [Malassezia cuniculi]|uniref:Molecular chaperone n=1 Tax=Malassezia cuniculi TaxID=948313 RepID=A0AAF0J7F4_9BASI|nr:molecular chaperone [Malassezia cuniculi]